MPIAIARNTYATSSGSLTALRNRMIDRAPTRLNARAMLLPMMIMITATITLIMTRVFTRDSEYEIPEWVTL